MHEKQLIGDYRNTLGRALMQKNQRQLRRLLVKKKENKRPMDMPEEKEAAEMEEAQRLVSSEYVKSEVLSLSLSVQSFLSSCHLLTFLPFPPSYRGTEGAQLSHPEVSRGRSSPIHSVRHPHRREEQVRRALLSHPPIPHRALLLISIVSSSISF